MKTIHDEFELAGYFDISEEEKKLIRDGCQAAGVSVEHVLGLYHPSKVPASDLIKLINCDYCNGTGYDPYPNHSTTPAPCPECQQ